MLGSFSLFYLPCLSHCLAVRIQTDVIDIGLYVRVEGILRCHAGAIEAGLANGKKMGPQFADEVLRYFSEDPRC